MPGIREVLHEHQAESEQGSTITSESTIWVCWWQGEGQMPPIVKVCYDSIRRHAQQHRVVLVTEQNFAQYVELPDYILRKFKEGKISIAHLSDILRVCLLSQYGGIWTDCTNYLTRDIDDIVGLGSERPVVFYSQHHKWNSTNVARGHWVSSFWAAGAGNPLATSLRDFFFDYWKNNDAVLTYLMFDYFFSISYNRIGLVQRMVDTVPLQRYSYLRKSLNEAWTPELAQYYTQNYGFHKLTYKMQFVDRTPDGRETVIHHMLSTGRLEP